MSKDAPSLQQISRLDGCYVLKTDLSAAMAAKELVHERYKDLAQVEWAFRTTKTTHLEMRPRYLRLATRTAEVTLPEALPSKGVRVATKKKLAERRKAA